MTKQTFLDAAQRAAQDEAAVAAGASIAEGITPPLGMGVNPQAKHVLSQKADLYRILPHCEGLTFTYEDVTFSMAEGWLVTRVNGEVIETGPDDNFPFGSKAYEAYRAAVAAHPMGGNPAPEGAPN